MTGLASLYTYKKIKSRSFIEKELKSEHWNTMYDSFKKSPNDSLEIVFLGNSITEQFDLDAFKNPHVVNRGISGDFTEGILHRLDEVVESKPKKIFIEIGVNDIVEFVSAKTVLENYEKILNKIHEATPGTKIYVHSIFPISLESSILRSTKKLNVTINEVNRELQELSKKFNATYIDINSKLKFEEKLNSKYTFDGIHLNEEGYKLWKDIVEPYVNE